MNKTKRMRASLILFLGAAVLASALVLMLLAGEGGRNRLFLEYRAEKQAARIVEELREQGSTESDLSDSDVLGFGLYRGSGESIVLMGTAPRRFNGSDAPDTDSVFTMDNERGALSMVRRLGMIPPVNPRDPRGGGRMPRRADIPQFLFFEIDARPFLVVRMLMILAMVGFPVIFIGGALLLWRLFTRNEEYRTRLVEQEELAHLGQAARTIAHEIKNPLGAIKLQTALVKKRLPDTSIPELEIIDTEVMRLASLTDRIREFLREPEGSPAPVEIGGFLNALVPVFDAKVIITNPAAQVEVMFDGERLRSVFENIIKNAVESYTPETPADARRVEVEIRAERVYVEVAVRDHGRGLDQESAKRAFEPFFTTREQGQGIGLALARRFVEAQGGAITLTSAEGGGTTVTVRLSRKKD